MTSRSQVIGLRVLGVLGIGFAVLAAFVADDTTLSLGFGATAAGFLTLAGLVALALRMPPLPPFVLPAGSLWQERVRQALEGNSLSRLQVLESLEGAGITTGGEKAGGWLLDRREEIVAMSRREFDQLLRSEVARMELQG